jgi:hypothetical protein
MNIARPSAADRFALELARVRAERDRLFRLAVCGEPLAIRPRPDSIRIALSWMTELDTPTGEIAAALADHDRRHAPNPEPDR